jgi:choline dehydrogenase
MDSTRPSDCEYVVVGSGAGGGTVAARLTEAGRRVVLLEAGGDAKAMAGADRLPDDYDVPVFHPFASENEAMAWNFFVRHYADDAQQRQDPKYRETWNGRRTDGVLYPRAGTLGGCTAHNAMIMLYPHNADWDTIARDTGDTSWSASRMRRYFQRLENCGHRRAQRWLSRIGLNLSRHGFHGWLSTERAVPAVALGNREILAVMRDCLHAARDVVGHRLERARWFVDGKLDPNDWRLVKDDAVGLRYTPLTTSGRARTGTRERVLETARRHPDRLRIELNALATRVLFDGQNRAVGVEYRSGERLYRAHPRPSRDPGQRREVHASREVILAGGAFNTPQLLMLSGIGPPEALQRHGIDVRVELPGVGKNLQDRYEVSVIHRMSSDWSILEGAQFFAGDRCYDEWTRYRDGVYITNGGMLGVITRSRDERPLPDLFVLVLLADFRGYFPGYSAEIPNHHDRLTWTILKAHTNNQAGEVTLKSADPRDEPRINFRYFEEGSDARREDLDSVVAGVKHVRKLAAPLRHDGHIGDEELPGDHVQSEDDLKQFVRNNAWGHHASCSCHIGPRNEGGVLSSDFRVHGTRGLRVVDASVFPRIPGFFIASAVYMIGEKAADVILRDAARGASP